MAQKTDIRLRRSDTAGKIPTSSNLSDGELAINTNSGALYFKKSDDTIITVHDNTILHIDSDTTGSSETGTSPKVGIGTTSPIDLLTISGDNKYIAHHDGSNYAFRLGADSSGDGNFILYDSSGTVKVKLYGESGASNYINNGGNFGIGTNAPGVKFHVNSGTTNRVAKFVSTDATAFIQIADSSTTATSHGYGANGDDLSLYANDAERIRIKSDGNVGIGTNSPNKRLDIHSASGTDTVANFYNPSTSWGEYALVRFQTDTKDTRFIELGYYRGTQESERAFVIEGQSDNRLLTIIETTGDVGIGEASPDVRLHVKDTTQELFKLETDQTSGYARFYEGTSERLRIGFGGHVFSAIPSATDVGIRSSNNMHFGTDNNIRMTILDSNGNVGIGTTSPSSQLQVKTTGENSNVQVSRTSGTTILLQSQSALGKIGTTSNHNLQFMTNSGGRMTIDTSGKVGIGTTSPLDILHIVSSSGDVRQLMDAPTGSDAEIKFAENNVVQYTIGHDAGTGSFVIGTTNVDTEKRLEISGTGVIKFNGAYTFPTSDGSAGQVLKTDGSGNLSFAADSGGGGATDGIEDADGDTKIQVEESSDEDIIRFDTAGSQRMVILANGNVGINKATPGAKLTVAGSTLLELPTSSNSFRIQDTQNSAERFRVTQAGNVGIGDDSPDSRLHISGTTGGWDKHITIEHDGSDVGKILVDTDGMKFRNMSSGNGFYFRDSDNNTDMVIDSSGQVGIGIGSTPGQKLDVGGIIRSTSSNPQVRIHTSSGTGAGYLVFGDSGDDDRGWISYLHASDDMQFRVNASEAMRILSSGNVGIGTAAPGYRLEVAEDTDGTADLLFLRNSDTTYAQTWAFQSDTSKDLVITGSSGSGGISLVPGSRGLMVTGNASTTGGLTVGDSTADVLRFTGLLNHGSGSGTTIVDDSRRLQNISAHNYSNVSRPGSDTSITTSRLHSSRGTYIANVPFGDSWHDVFAHRRHYTWTYETSTDGSSFSSATINENIFDHNDETEYQALTSTIKAVRWTVTNISFSLGEYINLGVKYSASSPAFSLKVESSTDGTNYTDRLVTTNVNDNSSTYWFKVDGYGGASHLRITLAKQDLTNTNGLDISRLGLWTPRPGDQGKSKTDHLPFNYVRRESIDLIDNQRLRLGASQDLQIYHDGTHSYMDSSTGSLYIRTGNTLQFKNQSGSETLATFAVNGASTLYHDNSAKLATTSTGIDVTGTITADALTVDDITINGSTISDGGSITIDTEGDFIVDSEGDVYLDAAGNDWNLNSAGTNVLKVTNTSGDISIKSMTSDKDLIFKGVDNGSTITALTLDMSSGGSAFFGHDAVFADNGKVTFGAGSDLQIYHDGSNSYIDNSTADLRIRGAYVKLQGLNGENMLVGNQNGAVELYHDNSKKLETTSTGASVTGDLAVSGDLNITGNINSVSVTDLDVTDKTITMAVGSGSSANADDAGIIIEGPTNGAKMLWDHTNQYLEFNKDIFSGNIITGTTATKVGRITNASGVFNIQSYTNRQISFGNDTNGEHLRIDADGNVGIGTTTPGQKLEVAGRIRATTDPTFEAFESSSKRGGVQWNTTSDYLNIFSVGGDIVFDTNGENVGIGTDNPSEPLHVHTGGTSGGMKITSTDADSYILLNETSDNKGFYISLDGNNNSGSNHSLSFFSQNAGTVTNRMMITNNGNVGINSTNPGYKLDVGGDVRFAGSASIVGTLQSYSGAFNIKNIAQDQNLNLQVNDGGTNTTGLTVQGTTANVGIGTSSPQQKLTVNGAVFITDDLVSPGSAGTYTYNGTAVDYSNNGTRYWSWGSGTARGTFNFIQLENDGTNQQTAMSIDASGNVGIGTTAPGQKLEVAGNVKLKGSSSHFINIEPSGSVGNANIAFDGSNFTFTSNSSTADMVFQTSSTTRMTLHQDGNLDIYNGESSNELNLGRNSNEKLNILVNDANVELTAHQDSDSDGAHRFKLNRAFSGTGVNEFVIQKGGTNQLRLDTNGYLYQNNSTNAYIHRDGQYLINQTAHGYIRLGPNNTGFAHIETDRAEFYFNRKVTADSGIFNSYNEDLVLQRANTAKATFGTTNTDFTNTRVRIAGALQRTFGNSKRREYRIASGQGTESFLLGKIEHNAGADGAVEGIIRFAYDYGETANNCAVHFNFAVRSGTARGTWWYEHDDDDDGSDVVKVVLIDDGSGGMFVWVTAGDYAECYVETTWRQCSEVTDSGTLSGGTLTTGTTLFDTSNDPTSEMHIGSLYAHNDLYLQNKKLMLDADADTHIQAPFDDLMAFTAGGTAIALLSGTVGFTPSNGGSIPLGSSSVPWSNVYGNNYYVGSTQILDSSRNLTNIANITSSGTITTTGGTLNIRKDGTGDGANGYDINFMNSAAQGADDRLGIIRITNQGGDASNRGGKLTFFTRQSSSANFNSALILDKDAKATFAGEVHIPSAVVHNGDTDTTFGFHGNDLFRVVTGGTERFEVGNSGIRVNDGGNDVDFTIESANNANMFFLDGGNDRISIGTSSGSAKLTVSGGDDQSSTGLLELITSGGTNLKLGGNTNYSWIQSHASKPLYINELGNNVIFNVSGGSVAIGHTNPAQKLDVLGAIRVNSAGDRKIDFLRTGGNHYSIEHDTAQIYFYNHTTSEGALKIRNNGNVIMSAGNVGVGTGNTPLSLFHVQETALTGATATAYAHMILEDTDAQMDLTSSHDGTWGSSLNFKEHYSANSSLNDVWSIARKTTNGDGDSSLNFNFGTNNQHDNTTRQKFHSDGRINATGSIESEGGSLRGASSDLLQRRVSNWSIPLQTVIGSNYGSNLNDYVYLKAPGNSSNNHGIVLVTDNSLYYGRTSIETGQVTNDAEAPLNESVGLKLTHDGDARFATRVGIGTFPATNNNANNLDTTEANRTAPLHIRTDGVNSGTVVAQRIEHYAADYGATPLKVALEFKGQDSNNFSNFARLAQVTVNDTDYGDNNEATSHFIMGMTSNANYAERFMFHATGHLGIGSTTAFHPTNQVNTGSYFKPDTAGKFLNISGGSGGAFINLLSGTTTDSDQIGGLYFTRTSGAGDAHKQVAGIDVIQVAYAPTNTLEGGTMRFFTKPSGSGVNVPRMTIDSNGQVSFMDSSGNADMRWNQSNLILNDNNKVIVGTSSDLQIYHDGSNSFIKNNTNDLYLDTASGSIHLTKNGTSEVMASFTTDGAVTLRHNNNIKLATTSTGVTITGLLSATTKSFDIEHPTKEGKRLRHGVLEGPEHGVYIRGKHNGHIIELPDYWTGLVDEDSITVQLTAIGKAQELYVENIEDNKVYIGSERTIENYFYYVQAERKDVDKIEVEYSE